MFERQRFCGHSADATRTEESRKGDEQVYREKDQITHELKEITFVTLRKTQGAARSDWNCGITREQATRSLQTSS